MIDRFSGAQHLRFCTSEIFGNDRILKIKKKIFFVNDVNTMLDRSNFSCFVCVYVSLSLFACEQERWRECISQSPTVQECHSDCKQILENIWKNGSLVELPPWVIISIIICKRPWELLFCECLQTFSESTYGSGLHNFSRRSESSVIPFFVFWKVS